MRLISLNIWGGKVYQPLIDFLREVSTETDVFCFQEVFDTSSDVIEHKKGARVNIYSEMTHALPEFHGYYAPAQSGFGFSEPVDFDLSYGLAIFVKNGITIHESGDIFVYGERNGRTTGDVSTMPRNLQYISFEIKDKLFTLYNFHGLWYYSEKTDNAHRLEQSKKIVSFMNNTEGEKILCGDFNLLPDTQSLSILEKGMRNLIKENNIHSTRSELYLKDNKFADYTLVSAGVKVHKFTVLNRTVSDHLPMLLDFD